jgi:hypothetical protein
MAVPLECSVGCAGCAARVQRWLCIWSAVLDKLLQCSSGNAALAVLSEIIAACAFGVQCRLCF